VAQFLIGQPVATQPRLTEANWRHYQFAKGVAADRDRAAARSLAVYAPSLIFDYLRDPLIGQSKHRPGTRYVITCQATCLDIHRKIVRHGPSTFLMELQN
jgi:hypothetical protein